MRRECGDLLAQPVGRMVPSRSFRGGIWLVPTHRPWPRFDGVTWALHPPSCPNALAEDWRMVFLTESGRLPSSTARMRENRPKPMAGQINGTFFLAALSPLRRFT